MLSRLGMPVSDDTILGGRSNSSAGTGKVSTPGALGTVRLRRSGLADRFHFSLNPNSSTAVEQELARHGYFLSLFPIPAQAHRQRGVFGRRCVRCRARWCFGFWPDTGKTVRLSALLLHPRGRKCGSEGREDQEQIIAAKIRKIGGKKRSVAALHERSPQLVESADFRFPPMGPCYDGFNPKPGGLPEALGWLAVY